MEQYEFRKIENRYFIRLNKDAEIVSSLKNFCKENNVTLGTVQGIGAINTATFGLFDPVTKEYREETFTEPMEISCLLGNISTKDGETYLHLHMNASGKDYAVKGGHLVKAVISLTGEIVITPTNGKIERIFDENIGLNLFKFL